MAHVMMPEIATKMTEPRTIQPPHCTCGTNSSISTRKASKVIRKVGRRRMNSPSRYRAEWEGE